MTLPEFIAELEKTTGPSRELDAAIARAIGLGEVEWDDGEVWCGRFDESPVRVPAFSESLDAAMTLVPPEMLPLTMVIFSTPAKAGAQDGTRYVYFEGATPALALCIAALRARLAGQKEHP